MITAMQNTAVITRNSFLGLLVKYRNGEESSRKNEPYHNPSKDYIEDLAYHIKPYDFSSLKPLNKLLEIGIEPDAGKGKHEAPVLVLVEHLFMALTLSGPARG